MRDYQRLKVWQKAHQLVLGVYEATHGFPAAEQFGLTRQLRRCAASIPSNLAEGCGRHSDRDFARFVSIAAGSANEAHYQLLLAKDLGYLDPRQHALLSGQVVEVRKMLAGLGARLRR